MAIPDVKSSSGGFMPDVKISGVSGSRSSPGSFKDVIPVVMHSARDIDTTREIPEPEAGAIWGQPSRFENSSSNPPEGDEPGSETPPPAQIRYERFERKVEVEALPGPESVDIETIATSSNLNVLLHLTVLNPPHSHNIPVTSSGTILVDRATRLNKCDLGEENWNEIAGFTAYADGSVVERFRPVRVQRWLTVDVIRK